jgi:hypothetical protein
MVILGAFVGMKRFRLGAVARCGLPAVFWGLIAGCVAFRGEA